MFTRIIWRLTFSANSHKNNFFYTLKYAGDQLWSAIFVIVRNSVWLFTEPQARDTYHCPAHVTCGKITIGSAANSRGECRQGY